MKTVLALLVGFKQAFYKVREGLTVKLKRYETRGNMMRWIVIFAQ